MPKTPSIGIDQNEDGKFIDRYIGNIPMYLHYIPEAGICIVNLEYVLLLIEYMNGELMPENISTDLLKEFNDFLDKYGNENEWCAMSDKQRAFVSTFEYMIDPKNEPFHNPPISCSPPDEWIMCSDYVCCSQNITCRKDISWD